MKEPIKETTDVKDAGVDAPVDAGTETAPVQGGSKQNLESGTLPVDFDDATDSGNILENLGLLPKEEPTNPQGSSDDATAWAARERELQQRLTDQGRELAEIKRAVGLDSGNNYQRTPPRQSTGDPHTDNMLSIADGLIELQDEWRVNQQTAQVVEAYMDEGIPRDTARELARLEKSTDFEDRRRWKDLYMEADQNAKRQELARQQQLADRGVYPDRMTGSGTTNQAPVSAESVASKLKQNYSGDKQLKALDVIESQYGEAFADEVLSVLGS